MCWGSFLNVLGYRLISRDSLWGKRSFCPLCKHLIVWYDNIPVLSWLFLSGRCRFCRQSISCLYIFIEVITAVVLSYLYLSVKPLYFASYFIFISALIVTIRSDIETMLISRWVTLFLVPAGLLLSFYQLLPISVYESLLGAVFGYSVLFFVNAVFKYYAKKDGIGEGDFELLCLIGSFLGPWGVWVAMMVGSCLGCLYSCMYLFYAWMRGGSVSYVYTGVEIPFGPFLAFGAMVYLFFQKSIPLLMLLR